MKLNKAIILALAAASAVPASASGVWNLQGVEYKCDTLQHYKVGPGTTITVVDLAGPVKQRVFYSVTDLTDPNVKVSTICGKNNLKSNVTLPNMVSSYGDKDKIYFAGVNSDLFSSTGPIGTTVVGGEIYKTAKTSTAWKAAGCEADGGVYFGAASISFGASLNGVMEYAPGLVNVPRAAGEAVVYTSRWGTSTPAKDAAADAQLVEIVLKPEGGRLNSNGDTECTVVSNAVKNGSGKTAIPSGHLVLTSNVKNHVRDLGLLKAGDKYTITVAMSSVKGIGFGFSHSFANLCEMSGGNPLLLEGGAILDTENALDHLVYRRPRTALGTDASGKRMVMLVVDGDSYNKGISAGVNSKDLAAMMLAVGCTEAVNFDGGGSSSLYTSPFGVLNRPSDGHDRAVRNGWFVTTENKGDNAVATIAFADWSKYLNPGDTYTPVIYGYNEAGLLVNKDVKTAVLSCQPELGTISADGRTLTVDGDGTHALVATLPNGASCSIAVAHGDPTGISGPSVSEEMQAPVEYFNLQGVKVENPAGGIFIRRCGSSVSKVVM